MFVAVGSPTQILKDILGDFLISIGLGHPFFQGLDVILQADLTPVIPQLLDPQTTESSHRLLSLPLSKFFPWQYWLVSR